MKKYEIDPNDKQYKENPVEKLKFLFNCANSSKLNRVNNLPEILASIIDDVECLDCQLEEIKNYTWNDFISYFPHNYPHY